MSTKKVILISRIIAVALVVLFIEATKTNLY